jgi:ribonuclease P protein component
MLPAAARVRVASEHREIARHGVRGRSGPLSLRVLAARPGQLGQARAAVVVPKAVGGAVTRNLVKRRIRHLLAPRLATLPAGTAVVVRAEGPGAVVSSGELAAHLGRAFDAAASRGAQPHGERRRPPVSR